LSNARLAPGRAFPPYAFLPGRDPHPTRDPRGHSYGRAEPAAGYLPSERWRENEDYLFGIDLYNHGYLWEAHEVWERLWHASKGDPLQADLYQGLIQCAAAALKVPMGQPRGLASLTRLAVEKLERVARAAGGDYMGLDLFELVQEMRAFAASEPAANDGRPRLTVEP
jgi:predicted metal-dependent hydrolase